MASELREAALFYRRRGWSVFPVSPVSKKPMVESWYEFQNRLPTEQEITDWWRRYPSAGVGIVTGKLSGLVVLDVDPRHGGDPNHVYKKFPTTIVAQTGSGGGHFYYQHPGGDKYVPNAIGKKNGQQTGYDIRGDGGYVVAPPSLHPSGRRYEWIDTAKKPSPIPSDMLAWVTPKADLNGNAESKEPWLADALRGVGEGARDDTAARLAGYYLSKGIGSDVVLETLRNWNAKNDPPLPDADIDKVVESVQRTRSRHAQPLSSRGRDLQDAPHDPLRLISLHQYMAQYGDEDVTWAVEGWLPDQTIAMMVSPPGTYKTWTLIDLAVSISTGTPFLGTATVKRAGPVLVYQQEDFHGQMAQRISTIMASRFEIGWFGDSDEKDGWTVSMPPSPPVYFHDNRELRFDNKDIMEILENRIAELRPVAVIIDPLYTAAPMDDYMAKAVPHMMKLKKIRDRYHCSFIIAHHTSKRSADKLSREDLWGSQFLNAFLETGWQVRPKSEGTALVRRHFKVTKDIEEQTLTFDIRTDMPTHYRTTLGEPQDDLEMKVLNALDTHGPMTQADLARAVKVNKSTISRSIRELITSKTIRFGTDNKYRSAEHFDVVEAE